MSECKYTSLVQSPTIGNMRPSQTDLCYPTPWVVSAPAAGKETAKSPGGPTINLDITKSLRRKAEGASTTPLPSWESLPWSSLLRSTWSLDTLLDMGCGSLSISKLAASTFAQVTGLLEEFLHIWTSSSEISLMLMARGSTLEPACKTRNCSEPIVFQATSIHWFELPFMESPKFSFRV